MDDPNGQSERTPAGAAPRRSGLFYDIRPRLIAAIGAGASLFVLAVIPLFVSFSSTQIKGVFEQFTGGCVLVLDKSRAPGGKVFVSGRIAGVMPDHLPLMFEGRDALINSIVFASPYREDQIREPDDLTYHPSAGQYCPGSLCEGYPEDIDFRTVEVMLRDLRPEFAYRFLVRLKIADPDDMSSAHAGANSKKPNKSAFTATPDNLKVYAHYRPGIRGEVCRVEPRRWFNFWVWATPLKKAVFFIFVIVAGGLLLRWARAIDKGAT